MTVLALEETLDQFTAMNPDAEVYFVDNMGRRINIDSVESDGGDVLIIHGEENK